MELNELVSTRYGDYQGLVSMDRQDMYMNLVKTFDLPEGVIVGMGIDFGEIREYSMFEDVTVIFLIADLEYGNTMDEIMANMPDFDAKLTEVRKSMPISMLGRLFKRFSCMGINKSIVDNLKSFELR